MLEEVGPIQLLIPHMRILVVVDVWNVLQHGLLGDPLCFSQLSVIESANLRLLLLFTWGFVVIWRIIWDQLWDFLVESHRNLRLVLRLHFEINLILVDICWALLCRSHLFLETIWSQRLCKHVHFDILLLDSLNSFQQICYDLGSHRWLHLW